MSVAIPGAAERSALSDDTLSYIRYIALDVIRRSGREVPVDDLVAYGVVGYLEAQGRYDRSYGTTLHQYAWPRIHGAMIDGVRRWSAQREVRASHRGREGELWGAARWREEGPMSVRTSTSFVIRCDDAVYLHEDPEGTTLADLSGERGAAGLAEPHRHLDRDAKLALVRSALQALDKEDRWLFEQYYDHGRTMPDIAEEVGCTKSWVCKSLARIHREIRRQIRKTGAR
jgi:RNA polymerase sigma factor for flagellar operon FliA